MIEAVLHLVRALRQVVLMVSMTCLVAPKNYAKSVEEWNEVMTAIFQAVAPPPARAARDMAIVHTAMADAVTLVTSEGHPFWSVERPERPNKVLTPPEQLAAAGVAADTAARITLESLYPSEVGRFPAKTSSHESQAFAVNFGKAVALAALEARKNDGASTTVHYVPSAEPGKWRRTTNNRPPELPHWPSVRPFCLRSASQLRPAPPPVPTSPEAIAEMAEVAKLGSADSNTRTAWQTEAARFWSDFSYTSTPPGHWNAIARSLSRSRKLSLKESSRLFACLNLALADAGIACWEAKYHYNHWRPITALRATGGSTAEWQSLLPAPSHPEHVSGHSAFSAAAATVLAQWFPEKGTAFEVSSDTVKGVVKSFSSFSACVEEIGLSRIWGGIHFPAANREGQRLGYQVAKTVFDEWFSRTSTKVPKPKSSKQK